MIGTYIATCRRPRLPIASSFSVFVPNDLASALSEQGTTNQNCSTLSNFPSSFSPLIRPTCRLLQIQKEARFAFLSFSNVALTSPRSKCFIIGNTFMPRLSFRGPSSMGSRNIRLYDHIIFPSLSLSFHPLSPSCSFQPWVKWVEYALILRF